MATVNRTLSSRAKQHEVRILVSLPSHHLKGTPHGEIVLDAQIKNDDTLEVNLWIYGEGTQCPGVYRGTFSAVDLGVSSKRRTRKGVQADFDKGG